MKMNRTTSICIVVSTLLFSFCFISRGQFWDGGSGLLQSPSADMYKNGTFTVTNNILNKHSISDWNWGYDTFSYAIGINLWPRIEIGNVCVLLDGSKNPNKKKDPYYGIVHNQDRHFTVKALLLKEGDFGLTWLPSIAIGISDPTTGTGADYSERAVNGSGNGFLIEVMQLRQNIFHRE